MCDDNPGCSKNAVILWIFLFVGIVVMLFGIWVMGIISSYGTFFYAIGLALILFSTSQLAGLSANKKINDKLDRIDKMMVELKNLK